MTPEQTRQAAAVMLAAGEKAQIQSRYRTNAAPWVDTSDPRWQWEDYDYRVKPEPREWWLVLDAHGAVLDANSVPVRSIASSYQNIHVREVIE